MTITFYLCDNCSGKVLPRPDGKCFYCGDKLTMKTVKTWEEHQDEISNSKND